VVTRVSRGASWVANERGAPHDERRLVIGGVSRPTVESVTNAMRCWHLVEAGGEKVAWQGLLDVLGLVIRRQALR